MNSAFRIKENLNLEISPEKVFALLPAGRTVPATWQQSFTTFVENQRSFDLHLLRGSSERSRENTSLGKWRIGGIPQAPKGEHRIKVEIKVGKDGSVGVRATLDDQTLPVTLLTDTLPKMPLTFRVPIIPLENAINQPCPQCRRSFVTRCTNWRGESFALCLDCGHEFEIPHLPLQGDTASWEDLPPELIKTIGIENPHTPGGLDAESLRELKEKGFDWSIPEEPDLTIDLSKIVQQIPGMIYQPQTKANDLSVDDILRMAGEPLAEDQRRKCPKCDAVIARDARRCEWCGQDL